MGRGIGIDLGTTYSAIATLDHYQRPQIVPNAEGKLITPSVVYISPQGDLMVGDPAKEMQGLPDQTVAAYFKRFMGDPNYQLNLGNQTCEPVILSSFVLQKLKRDAEAYLKEDVSEAVITVPAYFNNLQREATVLAAQKAGLKVLQIINEPTAAAIAFGLNQSQKGIFLVYDLGGGTFDVTLIKIQDQDFQVLATDGDHMLGGKDWDDKIVQFLAGLFEDETGLDPLEDIATAYDLLIQAEQAKMQLSQREKTSIAITYQGQRKRLELSRADFEELTDSLMQRTRTLCESVLNEKKLEWSDLTGVILVGGSTRMPMVSRYVTEMSGKSPLSGVDVDQAVAMGAAILAGQLQMDSGFTLPARKIQDVTSHSLGLVATNEDHSRYINGIILEKNKSLPCSETRPFKMRTGAKIQNTMDVYLLQGELNEPLDCTVIKHYLFDGIQHLPGGETVIDVTYSYDVNNLLQVRALQKENGKILTVSEKPIPNDLSWLGQPPVLPEVHLPEHLSVVLAIDLSGSMCGEPVEEALQAAIGFLEKMDLTSSSIALLIFAETTEVQLTFSQNQKTLTQHIRNWDYLCDISQVGVFTTANPFPDIYKLLEKREAPRYAIVLTDGEWDDQQEAIRSAKKCHLAEIEVIALGFGDADQAFLRAIATSDENALYTRQGQLGESFSRIAQVLTSSERSNTSGKGLRIWQ